MSELWKWTDCLLHAAGGAALSAPALWLIGHGHPVAAVVYLLTAAGLLRELAQAVKSNIFRAVQDMPTWGIRGHAEWIAWGVGAAIAGVL